MKEKAVIFECSADAIIDIRKRLDEIASVTNGSIWFETIGQNAIDGNGPSLTKYSIICHYPESQMEIIDKYYEDKVRNIQNTFKSELDFVRKENEELKKRLKSAEQSDYITPLRDRVDVCEEKIDEHEADLEDCKNEIDILWNNAFTGLEKRVELFNNARKEDIQELFDDMEDRKKDISEQDRRLDCHHNRLMSISERVNTLSKQYNEFNEDIKELKDKLDKHIENCKTINNMHQHSIGIVDSMKTLDIIDINNRLSDLGSKLDDYIDDYKEAYKHLDNSDEALDRRIKALERSRECDWYALQQVRKDVTDLVNSVCDDNRTINNTLTDLNIRLKAIEKRLSVKPFYESTEDEKDDD